MAGHHRCQQLVHKRTSLPPLRAVRVPQPPAGNPQGTLKRTANGCHHLGRIHCLGCITFRSRSRIVMILHACCVHLSAVSSQQERSSAWEQQHNRALDDLLRKMLVVTLLGL